MKTDIKIIALDLDGTLLNSNKQLSERNRRALEAAAEKGIYIVPTTGRLATALTSSVSSLPFLRYVIAVNGAIISDIVSGETLTREEISNEDTLRILDILSEYNGIYDCYIDGEAFMNAKMLENVRDYTESEHQYNLVMNTRKPVEDIRAYVENRGCPVQKCQIMFKDRATRDAALQDFKTKLPDFLHSCTYSTNIEINSPGANKGAGLRFLCDYLHIPVSASMSFGDGSNDISMLQDAGIGVAMGNADDEIKQYADLIAPTCDEDGVAQIIEQYI